MAAMPIYGKNPLKIFSKSNWPITFKLDIQHWVFGPYKAYANDDPVLTMTYIMARSSLLPNVVWGNA